MGKRHIIAGLETLEESLHRLKGLLAWIALKESERHHGAPSVLITDRSLAEDLRNEQSLFMATIAKILDVLNKANQYDLPPDKCKEWRNEVLRLKWEMQGLGIPKHL